MSSVLKSLEWGEPALFLLSQCGELDPNLPAVMHIRHTERPIEEPGSLGGFKIVSTERGKKAAQEFGASLPSSRSYRLYHTYMERTRETAESIHEGILANEGSSNVIGSIPLTTIVDRDGWMYYARRESEMDSDEPWSVRVFTKWISSHYPPWLRMPALNFSQRGAALTMKNLASAEAYTFDIYVSHDVFVATFLLFWFGYFSIDWVQFLDGFIMQLIDEKVQVYTKNGKKEAYYPYWWKF
jgi:hypothetical protein